jgi:hypothetical protein
VGTSHIQLQAADTKGLSDVQACQAAHLQGDCGHHADANPPMDGLDVLIDDEHQAHCQTCKRA